VDDAAITVNPVDHRRAAGFIRAHTTLRPVTGVPEVRLHLADDSLAVWEATEAEVARGELDPPFWAFAWAGGQALARWVLDRPEAVSGRPVLDVATGSGLVAVAAALAGAAEVAAIDADPIAAVAARLNATANAVDVAVAAAPVEQVDVPAAGTVVLAGDVFYQEAMARRMLAAFDRFLAAGCDVVVGDPRRAYLPAARLEVLAESEVTVDADLEDLPVKPGLVARLLPG
jgi:predicted nicotinamide N-methyase